MRHVRAQRVTAMTSELLRAHTQSFLFTQQSSFKNEKKKKKEVLFISAIHYIAGSIQKGPLCCDQIDCLLFSIAL